MCREREGVCFEIGVCREIESACKGSGRECVCLEREGEREREREREGVCFEMER